MMPSFIWQLVRLVFPHVVPLGISGWDDATMAAIAQGVAAASAAASVGTGAAAMSEAAAQKAEGERNMRTALARQNESQQKVANEQKQILAMQQGKNEDIADENNQRFLRELQANSAEQTAANEAQAAADLTKRTEDTWQRENVMDSTLPGAGEASKNVTTVNAKQLANRLQMARGQLKGSAGMSAMRTALTDRALALQRMAGDTNQNAVLASGWNNLADTMMGNSGMFGYGDRLIGNYYEGMGLNNLGSAGRNKSAGMSLIGSGIGQGVSLAAPSIGKYFEGMGSKTPTGMAGAGASSANGRAYGIW